MSSDIMERIRKLFPLLLEVEEAKRDALLRAETAGEPELREELESLLAADPSRVDFLEGSGLSAARRLLASDSPAVADSIPPTLGRFRILRELGRGGMGIVYEGFAEDDRYRRRVALKVLRSKAAVESLRQRFETEGQILARLRHPHICRLLEGRETSDGRFFLAMEFAPGEPLHRYCKARGSSVEERIALVLTVCRAVQHAHRNLVVHRDLKPTNILVDEDGGVKLLDFGVAKLIRPQAPPEEAETVTLGLQRFLTPDYSCPEQLRGEPVTTQADVYSLGVLLYELLAGRRPFDLGGLTPAAIERTICAGEPPRPSRVAEAATEEGTRQLRRRLEGDLDLIVLEAMHRDPSCRYKSVEQLADDLDRHLRGLPVSARGDGVAYRLGKLIRRHRAGAVSVLAVVLATVLAAVVLVRQQRETARERDRAEKVGELLVKVIGTVDPDGPASDPEEFLRSAAEVLGDDLEDEPETLIPLWLSIGEVYHAWDRFDSAKIVLGKARELSRETFGESSQEFANSEFGLGIVALSEGRLAEADALFARSARTTERFLPRHQSRLGNILNARAIVAGRRGELDQAEQLYRESLRLGVLAGREEDPELAVTRQNYASLLATRGRYDEAIEEYRQALEAIVAARGREHPRVALVLNGLAAAYRQHGNLEEAEAGYREALEIRRSVWGDTHTEVGASLNSLGLFLVKRGRWEEGEPLLREALEIFEAAYGTVHPRVAGASNNLAMALSGGGHLEEARVLFERAMEIWADRFGPEHRYLASGQSNLGGIAKDQGRWKDARQHYQAALAIGEEALGPDHPKVAGYLGSLSEILLETADYNGSEALLRRALEIRREKLPGDHPDLARTLRLVGDLRLRQGRLKDAEVSLIEALEIQRKKLAEDALLLQRTRLTLAELSLAQGRAAEALVLARAASAVLEELSSPALEIQRAKAAAILGRTLIVLGRPAEGRPLLDQAMPVLERHYGAESWAARWGAGRDLAIPKPGNGSISSFSLF